MIPIYEYHTEPQSTEEYHHELARDILKALFERGEFGNSIRAYQAGAFFLISAIQTHFNHMYRLEGLGDFTLRELSEKPAAFDFDLRSPEADYNRPVFKTSPLKVLGKLREIGAIEKTGNRYRMGNLRNVAAQLNS